jgi:hypothetical protein
MVSQFTVSSTQAAGAGIKILCPFSMLRNNDNNWQIMKYYRSISWDAIDIKVLVSGTASTLRGALRVTPHTHMVGCLTSVNVWAADIFRGSTIPTVVVPFNRKDCVELSIPWNYNVPSFQNDMTLTFDANRYQTPTMLTFAVDQALGNITDTVCTLTYSVWMSFKNPRLYDPCLSLGGAPAVFAATITDTPAYSFITGATSRGEAAQKSKEGLVTGATRVVSEVASALSSLPVVGPAAAAVSGLASTASSVARIFNWDKPTSVDFASYTSLRIGDHLISTSGLDPSAVMNVDPTASEDISPALFGMDHDVGNIHPSASAYSILKIGQYLSTAADGDPIVRFPVNPGLAVVNAAPLNSSSNLSFVSQFFNFWRGDLRYRFTTHCDVFTNANVVITLSNVSPTNAASPYTALNNLRSMVTKVTGSTVIEFTVPYHGMREWDVVRQSSTEDTTVRYCVGIYCTTAPTRSGVKCNLDWTLEVACSDDPSRFQLCEPSDHKFFAHGAATLLGGNPQGLSHVSSAMIPINSMRELFRRYSFINPLVIPGSVLEFNPNTANPMMWWLHRFVGFRGSVRMTFYIPNNSNMFGYVNTPGALNPGATTSGIAGIIYKDGTYNPEVSLELHTISTKLWAFTPAAGVSFPTNFQTFQIVFAGSGAPASNLTVMGALGDDFFAGIYAPLSTY